MERSGTRKDTADPAAHAHLVGRASSATALSHPRHSDAIGAAMQSPSLPAEMLSDVEQVLQVLKTRVTFDEAQVASRALMPPQQVTEILQLLEERGLVRVTIIHHRKRYQAIRGKDPQLALV